jgi:hypothetical protein
MSFASFSKFEGPDFGAFVVCGLIGYLVGTLAPAGSALAIYSTILISYHLFLAWLILFSSGEHKEAGVSLALGHTILTHAACLIIILAPIVIARETMLHVATPQNDPLADMQSTDHMIRLFQALCCSIAGLAMFERGWLFSSEAPVERAKPVEVVAPVVLAATADDFEAWRQHLAQQKPRDRPAGASLKTEYEQWLLVRQRSRAVQAASDVQQG